MTLDDVPAAGQQVVLALGSNLGDRAATLRSAVAALASTPGLTVRLVSPVVETDPVGGPEQPDYLNAVLLATSTLSPRALLHACQRIEAAHERQRAERWGPRTLDIDLIDVAGTVAADADLQLPHPRAAKRAFVLLPWLQVNPAATLPTPGGARSVAELLLGMDTSGIRQRPDIRLTDPRVLP